MEKNPLWILLFIVYFAGFFKSLEIINHLYQVILKEKLRGVGLLLAGSFSLLSWVMVVLMWLGRRLGLMNKHIGND